MEYSLSQSALDAGPYPGPLATDAWMAGSPLPSSDAPAPAVPSAASYVDAPRGGFSEASTSRCQPLREAGFTIVELMMILVVVAVLLGIGGPSFQNSLQRNRMQSTVSEMAGALSLARSEAVIRSTPIGMCPVLAAGGNCSGSSWETGYMIFVDDGEGGGNAADGERNGDEEELRFGEEAPAGVTVRTLGFQGTGQEIVFAADGGVLQGQVGSLVICDARGAGDAAGLVVSVAGQTRFAVDGDDNGVVEDHTGGTDVTCP